MNIFKSQLKTQTIFIVRPNKCQVINKAPNLGLRVLLGQGYHTPCGAVIDEDGAMAEW
jgi:hypothetical protein